jgi:hypothetical protein
MLTVTLVRRDTGDSYRCVCTDAFGLSGPPDYRRGRFYRDTGAG